MNKKGRKAETTLILFIKDFLKKRIWDCDSRIAHGQGNWPDPEYVRDAIWEAWHTEKLTLESVLEIIERQERSYCQSGMCSGSGYVRVNFDGSPDKTGLTHTECPGCPNCNYEEIYCDSLDLEGEDE